MHVGSFWLITYRPQYTVFVEIVSVNNKFLLWHPCSYNRLVKIYMTKHSQVRTKRQRKKDESKLIALVKLSATLHPLMLKYNIHGEKYEWEIENHEAKNPLLSIFRIMLQQREKKTLVSKIFYKAPHHPRAFALHQTAPISVSRNISGFISIINDFSLFPNTMKLKHHTFHFSGHNVVPTGQEAMSALSTLWK